MIPFIVPIVAAWERIEGIHMHEMGGHKAGHYMCRRVSLGTSCVDDWLLGFYRFGGVDDFLGGGVTEYRA